MVRAPVPVLASAVLEKAAPAAAVVTLDALLVVRPPRCGTEPAIVIEASGQRLLRERGRGRKFTEPRTDDFDVADPAVAHDLGSFAEGFVRTLLCSGLQHPAAASRGVDEHAAF